MALRVIQSEVKQSSQKHKCLFIFNRKVLRVEKRMGKQQKADQGRGVGGGRGESETRGGDEEEGGVLARSLPLP